MIYRKFQGIQLSGLGLGMMRLPVLDGNDGTVNETAVAEMIDYAYILGDGAASGRETGEGFRGAGGGHAVPSPGGNSSRLGVPLPSEYSRCDRGIVRYVRSGAAKGQYCHMGNGLSARQRRI